MIGTTEQKLLELCKRTFGIKDVSGGVFFDNEIDCSRGRLRALSEMFARLEREREWAEFYPQIEGKG